jgi:hypothetical protein
MKKNSESRKLMSECGREEALPQGARIYRRNNVQKLILSRRVSRPSSLGIEPTSWFATDIVINKQVGGRADNATKRKVLGKLFSLLHLHLTFIVPSSNRSSFALSPNSDGIVPEKSL